jgi:hypothetical protein
MSGGFFVPHDLKAPLQGASSGPLAERAQAAFEAALARTKRLNAQGNRAGCRRALARAERMYNLQ